MDIIQKLEQEEMARVSAGKTIPAFGPGDTVIVSVNVVEGTRKRVQAFEGVVIGRRNRGLNSSFIVRKVSSGEGVERTFQLYSPTIASIEVKRRGDVRRAKLYYLRDRRGKSARIAERQTARALGLSADLPLVWMPNWAISWAVARSKRACASRVSVMVALPTSKLRLAEASCSARAFLLSLAVASTSWAASTSK